MSDQTYMSTPEFIIKFPKIDAPKTHKVEDFSGFVPVMRFNKAGRVPKGVGQFTDGNAKLMQCVPIHVEADEVICTLLNAISGIGLIDEKMEMIMLGRDAKDGQTERYKAELDGLEFEPVGNAVVMVTYKWYESKLFVKDSATLREEYDFIKNEARD